MSRQDRQGVRTPSDLERKYDFEKRFVLSDELDQDEVFNRLTNYGKSQGVFKGADGNLYVNASYLVTGILKSRNDDTFFLDLDNGILKGKFAEFSISGKSVDDIAGEAQQNAQDYADEAAQNAVASQTQTDVYNKLTNNGKAQGIYYQNGELYINASYITGAAPSNLLESVYPVGAIYMSAVDANPAKLFGFGTWEQIQDRFLLAAGSSYAAGTTGGEATHTLTVEEMPSHSHAIKAGYGETLNNTVDSYRYQKWGSSSYGAKTGDLGTQATGGGAAHNNMPPYLAVYVWKRVG